MVLASLAGMVPHAPQVWLLVVRCRTCQPEMPLSPASAQVSVTSVSPGVAVRVWGCAGRTVMLNVSVSSSDASVFRSSSVTVYV